METAATQEEPRDQSMSQAGPGAEGSNPDAPALEETTANAATATATANGNLARGNGSSATAQAEADADAKAETVETPAIGEVSFGSFDNYRKVELQLLSYLKRLRD